MNLISWLFTDPLTAGGGSVPETFHYLWQWIVFCSVGLIICFYYAVEGRKRFVKNKPVIKYMLDRYLGCLSRAQISERARQLPGSAEPPAVYP